MHMDATTAASAEGEIVQVLDQTCFSSGTVAVMNLISDGRMLCNKNAITSHPWNWIDPQGNSPGNPQYEFRGLNLSGNAPQGNSTAGVWVKIGFFMNAAIPNPGGINYNLGDTLTLVGGTFFEQPATYTVTGEIGGGVAAVSVVEQGSYSQFPGPMGIATTTDGGGSGCFLDVVVGFHNSWFYSSFVGLAGAWDVQIRQDGGPVLAEGRWRMSINGAAAPP